MVPETVIPTFSEKEVEKLLAQPHSVVPHLGQEHRHSLYTFVVAPRANLGAPVYLPEFPLYGASGPHHKLRSYSLLSQLPYCEELILGIPQIGGNGAKPRILKLRGEALYAFHTVLGGFLELLTQSLLPIWILSLGSVAVKGLAEAPRGMEEAALEGETGLSAGQNTFRLGISVGDDSVRYQPLFMPVSRLPIN
ncbi:hypothetical protein ES703_100424 [subsurface metagenome]